MVFQWISTLLAPQRGSAVMLERCPRNRFCKSISLDFIGSGSPEGQRGIFGKVPPQQVLNWFFDGFHGFSVSRGAARWCRKGAGVKEF